jgi:signal transduction histidine kinase/ligand-binding sensor domain-containing protein/CheY-like chemotaxis protein
MRAPVVLLATIVTVGTALARPEAEARREEQPVRATLPAASQRPDVLDSGRFAVRVFTDRDGLPQNTIHTITSDNRRYLWIGTQDGAARYNGRSWTVVHMPEGASSNIVSAVLGGTDGTVWFGTRGELFRLAGGTWSRFGAEAGIPPDGVSSLVSSQDSSGRDILWVSTFSGGILRFDGDSFRVFATTGTLPSNDVRSLLATTDPAGDPVLWVGTARGAARFAEGLWTHFTTRDGLPSDLVSCLVEERDASGESTIVAGTGGGLATFRDGIWSTETVGNGALGMTRFNRVICLLATHSADGSKSLWVGTEAGLARRKDGRWRLFGPEAGLPAVPILSLATPPTGRIPTFFVGTDGAGLARVDVGKLSVFDSTTGLPANSIRCFLETGTDAEGRTFWIGTEGGGLARYDIEKGQWLVENKETGLPTNSIRCVVEAPTPDGKRAFWVGTEDKGLLVRSGGRSKIYTTKNGLPDDRVRALLPSVDQDRNPVMWVATLRGLARLDARGWTTYGVDSGLPSTTLLALAETLDPNGMRSLWVATSGGVARLRDGHWRTYDRQSGLVNDSTLSLREVADAAGTRSLWVGTRGGVSRIPLDVEDGPITSFTRTSTPALPNTVVYEIREDSTARLYFLTNSGVVRLSPRVPTSDDPSEFSVRSFTTEDGLPSNEGNLGASFVDSKGRIWQGTLEGAVAFDPSPDFEDRDPKPVVIERSLLDGRNFEFNGASLHYSQRNASFEFALLNYAHETNARYRTQLVGFDTEPTAWTTDYKREFSSLPAGTYSFRVWGRDYAGNVSGPAEINFSVRPAPWLTWWAFLLFGFAFAGLGYGLVQLKTHALRRHNDILEAKVAERTAEIEEALSRMQGSEQKAHQASEAKSTFLANMSHELRTPLNAIFGFVQLLERDGGLTARQRDNLGIIARNSEHLLGLINDVLSITKIEAGQLTLNEQVFDLPRLLRGMEDLFRLRSESKGLTLKVDVAPDLPQLVWGDEGKLRQVLINLVANAVKFTDSGHVVLRARHVDSRALFEVEDTGPGLARDEVERLFTSFSQTESGHRSQEGTGLGLAISLSFVRLMGGDIAVRTDPGNGACFAFDVRLPAAVAAGARVDDRRVLKLVEGQPIYRVLVVDDKWENRSLLVQLLAAVGFQVLEASDGKEAVEAWIHWNPDLIWMDMRMPVMDGYEAVRAIRSYGVTHEAPEMGASAAEWRDRSTKVIIIALTAGAFDHDRERVLAAGCDDIVIKPFREHNIFEKMTEFLGVQYEHEDPNLAPLSETQTRFGAERLADVPADLLDTLNMAIDAGSLEEARATIDRIGELDRDLADELWDLVKNYRFDEVQELLARPASERE